MSPRVLGLASAGVGPRPTYSIICVAGGDVYSILYVVDFAVTGLEIPVEIALPSLNLRPLVCSSSNYPSAIRNVPRLGALTSEECAGWERVMPLLPREHSHVEVDMLAHCARLCRYVA